MNKIMIKIINNIIQILNVTKLVILKARGGFIIIIM